MSYESYSMLQYVVRCAFCHPTPESEEQGALSRFAFEDLLDSRDAVGLTPSDHNEKLKFFVNAAIIATGAISDASSQSCTHVNVASAVLQRDPGTEDPEVVKVKVEVANNTRHGTTETASDAKNQEPINEGRSVEGFPQRCSEYHFLYVFPVLLNEA